MEAEVLLLKAKFTRTPENEDEIAFQKGFKFKNLIFKLNEIINWDLYLINKGDVIELVSRTDDSWWEGKLRNGAGSGWFPSSYVRELKPKELEKLRKSKSARNSGEQSGRDARVEPKETEKKDWRRDVFKEVIEQSRNYITGPVHTFF